MIVKVCIPGKIQLKMMQKGRRLFGCEQGDIHYIGGTDVLPPPLDPTRENEVISELGTE